jgi:tRNA pseudouridine synthase 10
MDDWIEEHLDTARRLAGLGLCDRCLGRMFGKLGSGMGNDLRGRMLRDALEEAGDPVGEPDFCRLCENIFSMTDRFATEIADRVNSVESDDFLVGCKVDPGILAREKGIWDEHGIVTGESIKTELNREIGKRALPMINRAVEFKNPQVVACIDTRFADVSLNVAPVFIAGRYNKLSREIPQTYWPCRNCRGRGCDRCDGTGKTYQTSVQEIIGDIAREMCDGEGHAFHGMGREDIDALMLGDGRPFVLEIARPRIRDIDLDELERRANLSDLARYNGLRFVPRDTVQRYKAADPDKVYRATVRAQGKVNKERVNEVALAFENVQIEQRTPQRVAHRRADLVRRRTIRWVETEITGEDTFLLTLNAESGTYIKEFVSGDDGRTVPSFSEALGIPCRVEALDVLDIDYREQ